MVYIPLISVFMPKVVSEVSKTYCGPDGPRDVFQTAPDQNQHLFKQNASSGEAFLNAIRTGGQKKNWIAGDGNPILKPAQNFAELTICPRNLDQNENSFKQNDSSGDRFLNALRSGGRGQQASQGSLGKFAEARKTLDQLWAKAKPALNPSREKLMREAKTLLEQDFILKSK